MNAKNKVPEDCLDLGYCDVTKHWRRDFNSYFLRFPEQQDDEPFFFSFCNF